MKKLLSLFTALFLLMSTLPAQAGLPEISDLLTEYYKERRGASVRADGGRADLRGRCAVWA